MAPVLFAITDLGRADAGTTLERFARAGRIARPGSVVFQLRDLERPASERLAFGAALRDVARATEQRFVVNDRLDLAVLLGADGVHVGEGGLETSDARRLLGARAFVSRACHDPEAVANVDADAVLLSPLLAERKGRPALGLRALEVARRGRAGGRPLVVALGGIDLSNAAACLRAGADGVAAVGAVLVEEDVEALVFALGIAR